MRLLHVSDLHLGRALGELSREPEQRDLVGELIAAADELEVALTLISGDVFDGWNPPAWAEDLFFELLDGLAAVLADRRGDVAHAITEADVDDAERAREAARHDAVEAAERVAQAASRVEDVARRAARTLELRARAALLEPRARRLAQIRQTVAANQLAELAAERHLDAVTRDAGAILRSLSSDRYALVRTIDGAFAFADSALGGLHRPPSTLSGGETFLVSLALSLALSERIQLVGRARFDFFFLDEGFGGLDAVTLDAAVSALERLRGPHRVIGMITHLAAIEERMPRKLRVEPGRAGGDAGVRLEIGEPPPGQHAIAPRIPACSARRQGPMKNSLLDRIPTTPRTTALSSTPPLMRQT